MIDFPLDDRSHNVKKKKKKKIIIIIPHGPGGDTWKT